MPLYRAWRRDPYWFHLTFEAMHAVSALVLAVALTLTTGAWWYHRQLRKAY